MKALKLLFAAIVFAVFVFPTHAFAQNTQDFSFQSFDADYFIQKQTDGSSSMSVNETLVANFPSYDQNHGILRAIPEVYDGHNLHLNGLSVTQDGQPAKYTKAKQNDNLVLKIGDASTYVHGAVTYKVNYKINDVIRFDQNQDAVSWDINGDQWPQRFAKVTARIHVPADLAKNLENNQQCYQGTFGSMAQNCSITRVDGGNESTITASAANVGPNQTLTVNLGFTPKTFALSQAVINDKQKQKVEYAAAALLAVIPPIWAFFFMFGRWRSFGNDPKGRGIIIPEYEPPKGFNPLSSDFILKQTLRPQAFSAAIIDMAVNGYISIIEIPKSGLFGKKDYELKLNKTPEEHFSPHMLKALVILFGPGIIAGNSVKISDFKGASKQRATYKEMQSLEKSLAADLTKDGYFKKNPKDVKNGYSLWGIFLIFATFVLAWLGNAAGFTPLFGLAFGIGAAGVVVFIFSFIMPARTEVGVKVHDDLLGLKDYIKLAEADRLKFLQSPEGAEKLPVADQFDPKTPEAKVKLFEKLLPYAMLFNLEKDWAKQFEGIYASPPGWYQGSDMNAFNTGYLIGSLSDFNSATATNFSSPSSSSGGGAGGGGGGGGGGGW
jgi:uncharacterized membrane protein YgcG